MTNIQQHELESFLPFSKVKTVMLLVKIQDIQNRSKWPTTDFRSVCVIGGTFARNIKVPQAQVLLTQSLWKKGTSFSPKRQVICFV